MVPSAVVPDNRDDSTLIPPRVWVVTGTNSGLGFAVARYALAQGDKVIASVRSLAKFPPELEEAGATPLVLDLDAPDEELQRAAEKALSIYGYVDVLVNNAGSNTTGVGPVEEIPMSNIRAQFQSNLFGMLAFTQPFVRAFRLRRSGHIFNVSSIGSMAIYPSWGAYTASKAALNAFSEALQKEVALYGVKVYTILPGYFPTNIFRTHPHWDDSGPSDKIGANGQGEGVQVQDAAEGNAAANGSGSGNGKLNPRIETAYTDPVTQGYDSVNGIVRHQVAQGKIGDPVKFASRLFELVTGTGLAKGIGEGERRNWHRIPFGSDCGEIILRELGLVTDNIRATQTLWMSTDVEPERLHLFA